MTLGRLPSLRIVEDVPLPLPVDDEYWAMGQNPGYQPPGSYSILMFNVENIKLAKLLAAILERVYHPPSKSKAQSGHQHEDFSAMLTLDSELNAAADSIPDVIHWERLHELNENVPLVLRRQSNVLHAR